MFVVSFHSILLYRLIFIKGPIEGTPSQSAQRSEQISDAVRAEYELIDTLKNSAQNIKCALFPLSIYFAFFSGSE